MRKAELGATWWAIVGLTFCQQTGIVGGKRRQKRTEREGCEVRRVWQEWRSEAGATLLVLCKSLMESKPAVGFEPTTA